jgi:cyclopropane-fatty-acyl-phospholipid synthase
MVTKSTTRQPNTSRSTSLVRNCSSRFDMWLLRHLYSSLGNPQIRITMGSSLEVSPAEAFPVATIAIRDRRTLLQILLNPQLGFGDAYTAGRVTVQGSLVAMLETVFRSMSAIESHNLHSRIASPLLALLQRNSLRGARKNIHRHYDLGTEFFRLWLDSQLVYSGAYFSSPSLTLEEAQIAKMDYICRKLNLLPGERVVDIGCGWGALAFHMAKHYGAHILAVSNSHEQILWARQRAAELHLTHQVEFIEDDYRNISTQCDALVSVGMLEHVGAQHYRDMGRVIHRVLDSAGRGLIQTIGLNQPHPFNLWTRKRVFPGTYAPTLRQAMDLFEPGNFSVVDVENLRPHYARTLEHWLERFENSSAKVSEMFGADFVRLWRLYLAGSLAGFTSGALQHFQILFARKACQRIPLTRAQLYAAEHPVQLEEKRMYAVF